MRKRKPMARKIPETESKTKVICEGIGIAVCFALAILALEIFLF